MNLHGKIQGQLDSPLTEDGVRLARQWGDALNRYRWKLILTSDLGRAIHTAELINESLRLPVISIPELREQSWGRWSGLSLNEIYASDRAYLEKWDFENDWNYMPPEGESRQEVIDRATSAMRHHAERNPEGRILVVTHAGVMRFIFLKLLNKNFSPESIDYLEPETINWLRYANSSFRPGNVNERIVKI